MANIFLHVMSDSNAGNIFPSDLETQKSKIFRDTKLSKHQRNGIFGDGNGIRQKWLDRRLSFCLLVLLRKYRLLVEIKKH